MSSISGYRLAVAVMVVNQDQKILLVKGYSRGWEFPGGFVGAGETIKKAAIREVKEESGIDIKIIKLLGIEHDRQKSTIVFLFKGAPVSGMFSTSNETEDVEYFTLTEGLKKMTLESFKERMIRCLNEEEIPFFIE